MEALIRKIEASINDVVDAVFAVHTSVVRGVRDAGTGFTPGAEAQELVDKAVLKEQNVADSLAQVIKSGVGAVTDATIKITNRFSGELEALAEKAGEVVDDIEEKIEEKLDDAA